MSRLAKKPLPIPSGVSAVFSDGRVVVTGPKGELAVPIISDVEVRIDSSGVSVSTPSQKKQARANVGTLWSLIRSAMEGVQNGFTKSLEIQGVGFRAVMEGANLILNLGFSKPVKFAPADGITLAVEKNIIRIFGIQKEKVGQTAAMIRKLKKPEPYKGKGIRYVGEVIRMKAGKRAATGGCK